MGKWLALPRQWTSSHATRFPLVFLLVLSNPLRSASTSLFRVSFSLPSIQNSPLPRSTHQAMQWGIRYCRFLYQTRPLTVLLRVETISATILHGLDNSRQGNAIVTSPSRTRQPGEPSSSKEVAGGRCYTPTTGNQLNSGRRGCKLFIERATMSSRYGLGLAGTCTNMLSRVKRCFDKVGVCDRCNGQRVIKVCSFALDL